LPFPARDGGGLGAAPLCRCGDFGTRLTFSGSMYWPVEVARVLAYGSVEAVDFWPPPRGLGAFPPPLPRPRRRPNVLYAINPRTREPTSERPPPRMDPRTQNGILMST